MVYEHQHGKDASTSQCKGSSVNDGEGYDVAEMSGENRDGQPGDTLGEGCAMAITNTEHIIVRNGGDMAAASTIEVDTTTERHQTVNNTIKTIHGSLRMRVVHIPCTTGSFANKLLLFMIHGFGQSADYFAEQISFYQSRVALCAVDVIGHGGSDYNVDDFSTTTIVHDLYEIFLHYRRKKNVVVGLGWGAALAVLLFQSIQKRVNGLVLISPMYFDDYDIKCKDNDTKSVPDVLNESSCELSADAPNESMADSIMQCPPQNSLQSNSIEKLPSEIEFVLSPSSLQSVKLRWHERLPEYLMVAYRVLSRSFRNRFRASPCMTPLEIQLRAWEASSPPSRVLTSIVAAGMAMPRCNVYDAIDVPVLLLCGERDVDVVRNSAILAQRLDGRGHKVEFYALPGAGNLVLVEQPHLVNALINQFLISSAGFVSTGGNITGVYDDNMPTPNVGQRGSTKWSMKNFAKWSRVRAVGSAIGKRGILGMKTLRQDDRFHSPRVFSCQNASIGLVIDISSEPPPYLTSDLGNRIRYVKLPTVSKTPPGIGVVADFIALVRNHFEVEHVTPSYVAVHCHYGFNRTGFLIICYLVEVEGFNVDDAVSAFSVSRPPGIKHMYFIEELQKRYAHRTNIAN